MLRYIEREVRMEGGFSSLAALSVPVIPVHVPVRPACMCFAIAIHCLFDAYLKNIKTHFFMVRIPPSRITRFPSKYIGLSAKSLYSCTGFSVSEP